MTHVHPIEAESYEILAGRVDLGAWSSDARAIVARVIHATADLDYATTMVITDDAVAAGLAAVRAGAAVIADVRMTASGITAGTAAARTYLDDPALAGFLSTAPTRAAAAMQLAAARHPRGGVFVIGCAPTALDALIDLAVAGAVAPALVIGMPVGFVGAAAAKERLRASGLPAISNVGEKGGSAAAAAACNAIGRLVHG